jgi:hypothetical protein
LFQGDNRFVYQDGVLYAGQGYKLDMRWQSPRQYSSVPLIVSPAMTFHSKVLRILIGFVIVLRHHLLQDTLND